MSVPNLRRRVTQANYYKINPIRQIQRIENYRGYKLILYLPVILDKHISHLGYMDKDFFGYKAKVTSSTGITPQAAIDFYLDVMYFKDPSLDYSTFKNDNKYKIYMNSLQLLYDTIYKM